MNAREIEKKLIEAARRIPADERVPYRFERRVMARIQEAGRNEAGTAWAVLWWRTAVSSLALSLLLAFFSLATRSPAQSSSGTSLAEQFESTMYAAIDDWNGSW
ncbi:MAG: hypothetical protein J7M29_07535 [Verrucomicrobia bacterium]|nr:hypothetical protein [Verrucomicrobiota bacterium]